MNVKYKYFCKPAICISSAPRGVCTIIIIKFSSQIATNQSKPTRIALFISQHNSPSISNIQTRIRTWWRFASRWTSWYQITRPLSLNIRTVLRISYWKKQNRYAAAVSRYHVGVERVTSFSWRALWPFSVRRHGPPWYKFVPHSVVSGVVDADASSEIPFVVVLCARCPAIFHICISDFSDDCFPRYIAHFGNVWIRCGCWSRIGVFAYICNSLVMRWSDKQIMWLLFVLFIVSYFVHCKAMKLLLRKAVIKWKWNYDSNKDHYLHTAVLSWTAT